MDPLSGLEQDLKLARLQSDFYKMCDKVSTRGIELRKVHTTFLEELLAIEESKVAKLTEELELARKEIASLQLAREEDKREIERLNGSLMSVPDKPATAGNHVHETRNIQDAEEVQFLYQEPRPPETSDSVTVLSPDSQSREDGADEKVEPVAKGAVSQDLPPPPPPPSTQGGGDGVSVPSPPETPTKEAEPVARDPVLPPSPGVPLQHKKAEPIAVATPSPPQVPVQNGVVTKDLVVSSSPQIPTQKHITQKKTRPVPKNTTAPPTSQAPIQSASPKKKTDHIPKKYVPRWPDLGEYMLIRGAKLNALAVLQKSETKRLMKKTRISQDPLAEHSYSKRGRRPRKSMNGRSVGSQKRSLGSAVMTKKQSLVVSVLLSSLPPSLSVVRRAAAMRGRQVSAGGKFPPRSDAHEQLGKPFQCVECGRGFVRLGNFQRHLRGHGRMSSPSESPSLSPPPVVKGGPRAKTLATRQPLDPALDVSPVPKRGRPRKIKPLPQVSTSSSSEHNTTSQSPPKQVALAKGQARSPRSRAVPAVAGPVPDSPRKRGRPPKKRRGRPPKAIKISDDEVGMESHVTESATDQEGGVAKCPSVPEAPSKSALGTATLAPTAENAEEGGVSCDGGEVPSVSATTGSGEEEGDRVGKEGTVMEGDKDVSETSGVGGGGDGGSDPSVVTPPEPPHSAIAEAGTSADRQETESDVDVTSTSAHQQERPSSVRVVLRSRVQQQQQQQQKDVPQSTLQSASARHGQFQCEKCGKEFVRRGFYQRHILAHMHDSTKVVRELSGNESLPSPPPERDASKRRAQSQEEDPHSDTVHPGPYQCNKCGKEFIRLGYYHRHLRLQHSSSTEGPGAELAGDSGDGEGRTRPPRRDLAGQASGNLPAARSKPFQCKKCGKEFVRHGFFRKHLRGHSSESPEAVPAMSDGAEGGSDRDPGPSAPLPPPPPPPPPHAAEVGGAEGRGGVLTSTSSEGVAERGDTGGASPAPEVVSSLEPSQPHTRGKEVGPRDREQQERTDQPDAETGEEDGVPPPLKRQKVSAKSHTLSLSLKERRRGRPPKNKNVLAKPRPAADEHKTTSDDGLVESHTGGPGTEVKGHVEVKGHGEESGAGDTAGVNKEGSVADSVPDSASSNSKKTVEEAGKETDRVAVGNGKGKAAHFIMSLRARDDAHPERSGSPEIPFQITTLNVTVPPNSSSSSSSSSPPLAPAPAQKRKRRKTLESVLSSILEHKMSKNGEVSPDGKSDNSEQPERRQEEEGGAAKPKLVVGGVGKASKEGKRKTLFGKRAREKSEAFKLSVVADEVEKSNTIKLKTSILVPPKLKQSHIV